MNISKLKSIDTLSLVDKVEIQLLDYFKENDLQPGDPIAKELDLVEVLGVSRTVVREALLRLRTLGFIKSKKHKGMIFQEPDIINNFERVISTDFLSEKTLFSLLEFRLILEIGMVESIYQNKTELYLIELERILLEEEDNDKDNVFKAFETEYKFHSKLYQMSGNDMLIRFQNLLLPIFKYLNKINKSDEEHIPNKEDMITHRDLFEELKFGSPNQFREKLQLHLSPLERKITEHKKYFSHSLNEYV